ncbi:MAG: peptidyl-prolyl cis-trans isomerase [Deltaproteobacteria bacterium]|nr:peptidyl-prolyl cis-trans isomerase [Deltaproteobacteria bacterium]
MSVMKKNLVRLLVRALIALAIVLSAPGWQGAHADIIDGIVAVVDDQVIMYSDLQKKMYELGATEYTDAAARQVLQLMVEDLIVARAYKAVGLPPVDSAQAEEVAKKAGVDVESARSLIMKSTLMDIMVKSRVVVTESMLRDYYQNQKQYEGRESVHVKQIFIRNDAAKAKKALEELQKGTPFDEVAAKLSDVLVSGSPDIGWVAVGDLAEEARKELETAKPGALVGPVTLGDNILIYQVVERGVAGGKPIEEVRPELMDTLQERYRKEAFDHWLKMILADHYVGIFL